MPAPARLSTTAPRWTLMLLAGALALTVQGCCCCGGGGGSSTFSSGDELVMAAARGDAQRVRELLDAGVSPHSSRWSSGGSRLGTSTSAVEAAVDSGSWEAVEPLLVNEEQKKRALYRALLRTNLDIAQRLVQLGAKADPEWSFTVYTQALGVRERSKAEALVKLLVELGMDPNATFTSGTDRPPVLHYLVGQASYFPRAEEDAGSDSGQGGPSEQIGHTMASWAPEVFVLIAKPRLNAEDEKGRTALMKAASAKNQKLVQFLVEQGASPLDAGSP